MKKLIDDPWKNVEEKYRVGQVVKGTILKANPFGFFVELDPDIHGLAHVSELSKKPVQDITSIAKAGDTIDFMIVSIEPDQHRLGLSLKALEEGEDETETEESEEKTEAEAEDKPETETEA